MISYGDELTREYGPSGEIVAPGRRSVAEELYGTLQLEEETDTDLEQSGTSLEENIAAVPQEIWGMLFPNRDEVYIPIADDLEMFKKITRELAMLEDQVREAEARLNARAAQLYQNRRFVTVQDLQTLPVNPNIASAEALHSDPEKEARLFQYDKPASRTSGSSTADPYAPIVPGTGAASENPGYRIEAQWAPEEDKALETALEKNGTNFVLAWQAVLEASPWSLVSPRTLNQVYHHWKEVLLPRLAAKKSSSPATKPQRSRARVAQPSSRKPFKLLKMLQTWLESKKRPIPHTAGDFDSYCGIDLSAERRPVESPDITEEEQRLRLNPVWAVAAASEGHAVLDDETRLFESLRGKNEAAYALEAEPEPHPLSDVVVNGMGALLANVEKELAQVKLLESAQRDSSGHFYADLARTHMQSKERAKSLPPLPPPLQSMLPLSQPGGPPSNLVRLNPIPVGRPSNFLASAQLISVPHQTAPHVPLPQHQGSAFLSQLPLPPPNFIPQQPPGPYQPPPAFPAGGPAPPPSIKLKVNSGGLPKLAPNSAPSVVFAPPPQVPSSFINFNTVAAGSAVVTPVKVGPQPGPLRFAQAPPQNIGGGSQQMPSQFRPIHVSPAHLPPGGNPAPTVPAMPNPPRMPALMQPPQGVPGSAPPTMVARPPQTQQQVLAQVQTAILNAFVLSCPDKRWRTHKLLGSQNPEVSTQGTTADGAQEFAVRGSSGPINGAIEGAASGTLETIATHVRLTTVTLFEGCHSASAILIQLRPRLASEPTCTRTVNPLLLVLFRV